MGKVITVNDRMQKGYRYELTEPPGKNFHPDFKPDLSPKEVLALGAFCGKYMRDTREEFPAAWFTKAKFAEGKDADCSLNFYNVRASQPLSVWRKKGWIHPDDPRGWFQWYCRYWQGRRHEDDLRQIKRWKAFRRHAGQVLANCERGDLQCRPVQRQALLHWAYDSRKL